MSCNGFSEYRKKFIWTLKFLAVIYIVTCHTMRFNEPIHVIDATVMHLRPYVIYFGAQIFYFLSGYLFHGEKKLSNFITKKIGTIIVPWLFCGTLVYLYIYLKRNQANIDSWIRFLVGEDSHLYFLKELCIFYLIYFFIERYWEICKKYMIILSIAWLFIQIMAYNYVLQNPFFEVNNLLIFSFGFFLKKEKIIIENKALVMRKYSLQLCVVYVLISYLSIETNILSYFGSTVYLIRFFLFMVIMFVIASHIAEMKLGQYAINIGKLSFSIYLLHLPIAGVICWICNKLILISKLFSFISPFRGVVVVILTYVALKGMQVVIHNTKEKHNIAGVLLGIRF